MLLRPAEPNDAIAVARVHVRSWQAAYRTLMPDDYLDQLRPEDRAQRYAFDSPDPLQPWTIVAAEAGMIHGFATTAPACDPDLLGQGELCALYVDPDQWGRGLGVALVSAARTRLSISDFVTRCCGCWRAMFVESASTGTIAGRLMASVEQMWCGVPRSMKSATSVLLVRHDALHARVIFSLAPQTNQRSLRARNGIGRWKRQSRHPHHSSFIGRSPANVPVLPGRICAHNEEVIAGLQPAMPGTRRQHGHVSRSNPHLSPVLATQHEPRRSGDKAQHLVRSGVVMVKIVHAVSPLRRPSVPAKYLLEISRRVCVSHLNGASIEKYRQMLVVRHPPVSR
jgi:GNAT superfamily N-acetyltransferase